MDVRFAVFAFAACGASTATAPIGNSGPSRAASALPCGVAAVNELTNAVWSARAVGSCTIKSDGEIIRLVDASQVVVSVAKSGRSVGFFDPRIPRSGVRVGMVGGELARVAPTLDQIDCERGPRWFGDYLQCRLRGPQTLDCDNADGDVLIVLFDPRERDATTKGDAARASVRDREIRGLVETSCD